MRSASWFRAACSGRCPRRPCGPIASAAGVVALAALMLLPAACSDGLTAGSNRFGSGWFRPEGEPWTIQCLALTNHNRRATAESVAEVLYSTPGIDGRKVRVEHSECQSTVYYGMYVRRLDPETRRLEVTSAMNRDLRAIKELGVPGQGHYFADAIFTPVPTPDVGNPEWALDRTTAAYSLRVAIFANEPGFYERKKAAAEYVAMLRKEGYQAFYRHGRIHSEVCVGEFGEDALRSVTRKGESGERSLMGFDLPSPEVRALRAKRDFAFELLNLRKRSEIVGERKVYAASQLVRIRDELPEEQW